MFDKILGAIGTILAVLFLLEVFFLGWFLVDDPVMELIKNATAAVVLFGPTE